MYIPLFNAVFQGQINKNSDTLTFHEFLGLNLLNSIFSGRSRHEQFFEIFQRNNYTRDLQSSHHFSKDSLVSENIYIYISENRVQFPRHSKKQDFFCNGINDRHCTLEAGDYGERGGKGECSSRRESRAYERRMKRSRRDRRRSPLPEEVISAASKSVSPDVHKLPDASYSLR